MFFEYFIAILLNLIFVSNSQYCLDKTGKPVDWWVILKVPPTTGNSGYGYYDSQTSSGSFEYVNTTVDLNVSSLTQTFAQININQLERVAWNDQKPNNQTSSSKAHSKGVIAFSQAYGRGFYIVHSIPKYPAFLDNHNINMTIPKAEQIYGQHIACFSLSVYQLNNLALNLQIIQPFIYEGLIKLHSATKNIYDLAQSKIPTTRQLFQYYRMRPRNYTLDAIFKNNLVNGSIFQDGLIKFLSSKKIYAETWGRPLQAPWCHRQYQVNNVKQVTLAPGISWLQSQDHSKWVISGDKYSCFGDMNRMSSQWKRGGSFYCIQDPRLNAAMKKILSLTDYCIYQELDFQNKESQNLRIQ